MGKELRNIQAQCNEKNGDLPLLPDIRVAGLGLAMLLCGLIYYTLTRDPGLNYLISVPDALKWGLWPQESKILDALPSFFHITAFILLTLPFLHTINTKVIAFVAGSWMILNISLELLQLQQDYILDSIVTDSFQSGTFDYLDLVAIILGAVFAFTFALSAYRKKERKY